MEAGLDQARVVDSGGRIAAVDSVRALALLGVMLMNFSAMQMLFVGRELMANAGTVDFAAMLFDLVFLQGKARSCFAFLFGFGFAMMMMRVEAKGEDFRALYVRRMGGLFAFGLINQFFLFWGDILCLYALLGLALLPLRRLGDRNLLRLGLMLVIVPPLVLGLVEAAFGGPLPAIRASDVAARGLVALASPHYGDFVRFSMPLAIERRLTDTSHMLVYDLTVLGLFVIGSWTARRRIWLEVAANRLMLRRIAGWCIPLGLLLSLVSASRFAGLRAEGAIYGLVTAASAGAPILAFGYLAAAAQLFETGCRRLQRLLAPVGRMTLTAYLASGAIGCWFFYGFGLATLGKIGLAATNLLAVAVFLGLLTFSHMWLKRFRLGPAEYAWRLMTYGPRAPRLRPAPAQG